MRVESWLQVMVGSSHPGFDSSASVGKRAWTPEARMARSRPNSEVGTAPIYVGFGSSSGNSAADLQTSNGNIFHIYDFRVKPGTGEHFVREFEQFDYPNSHLDAP